MIRRTEKSPQRIYRPLIPITISYIIGIILGSWCPGYFNWGIVTCLTLSMMLLIRVRKQQWSIVLPLIICTLGGYLSIQSWLGAALPENHVSSFVDRGYWKIHGVVTSSPIIKHRRWQFELSTQRLAKKQNTLHVFGKVKVTGRGRWPGARIGDKVVFRGRLRSIRNFSNPGGFNYQRFMELKRIRARVYASSDSLKIVYKAQSGALYRRIEALREEISGRLVSALHMYASDVLVLLKCLILGDRNGVTPALRMAFNRAGVGHVLAISGLHVGMVASGSFALAFWMTAWIPFLSKRAWVGKTAAIFSLVLVMGYGMLSGLSPSTQRAMIIVTVFLLGIWVGLRHDWMNTLAIAALLILVIHPPAVLSISFQLSFAAVLAILAGANRISKAGNKASGAILWKSMAIRSMDFLRVSVVAILGTLPLVLYYFNQISVVGPVTNVVVIPLVGLIVLPAGLLGTLTMGISAELGEMFWHIAAWGAHWMIWVVQFVSSWSWSAVKCITPNGLEICLYYFAYALVLNWKKWPHRMATAAILFILIVADVGYWTYQRYGRGELRLTVLDVGQASANLLELPGGYTILVDGGGYSDNSIFDVGATVVAPALWHKKIKQIDLVVLSHANSDHLNGLLYILKYFDVEEVWSNQEPAPTKAYRQWSKLIKDQNIRQTDFDRMPRRIIRNGVHLDILAPPADFLNQQQDVSWRNLNNNSLVLRVWFGDISFLFSGDIMAPAEVDLVARLGRHGETLRSTILMVPHHGSNSSSTDAFIRAVLPKETVVSAGWKNRFNFPHPNVLKRLKSVGSRIWCTSESGAVEISTNGRTYDISAYRPKGSRKNANLFLHEP